ncbi:MULTISPECIES: anthrone oxygenase family protein [unclassified Isoptericola]|uniref:anthrone oxygenase family protein n=1 Tax=unclassified Isoptericola TaxID=2623355 RepID=UPI0036677AEA
MEWLPIVAVVVTGLMVGVELSVAFVINPIADALPEDARVLARAHGGRMLGRAMPPWYIGSTLLIAGTALVTTGAAALAWTALALMLVSVVLSITLLVPINQRGKTWTPETAPADHREQSTRWDRLHLVRLALIVGAFVLVTVAAAR